MIAAIKFLEEHNALSLSFISAGSPYSCALWYVHLKNENSLSLYFLSDPGTKHGKIMQSGSEVAFTIHKDEQSWDKIRGIQGMGYCEVVEKTNDILELYKSKFPFISQLEDVVEKSNFYRIDVRWLRIIDNKVAFAYKKEYNFM